MSDPDQPERPRYRGGPKDGREFPERFTPGHDLYGRFPSVLIEPDHVFPEWLHHYEFEAGDYSHRGTVHQTQLRKKMRGEG